MHSIEPLSLTLQLSTAAFVSNQALKRSMPWFATVALSLFATCLSVAGELENFELTPGVIRATEIPERSALGTARFLQILVRRNLEIKYSLTNTKATEHLAKAEAALYQPIAFATVRRDDRLHQRTVDEVRQISSTTSVLDEIGETYEFGLRGKLPTGAEFTLSQRSARKTNNLLPQSSFGAFDTEYTSLLNLTFKQPLLRNAGVNVTETDRRVAELEHHAALQQLIQQTLKTSMDGLGLYWQLYRAQETVRLRQEALSGARSLLSETQSRIAASRLPPNATMEVRSALLNREMELSRSQQSLQEAQAKVLTAIHATRDPDVPLLTAPQLLPAGNFEHSQMPALEVALQQWPPYQVALIRRAQASLRLDFARNQKLPALDLVFGYGATGLSYKPRDAEVLSQRADYPDWFVGLNIELPLGVNRRVAAQVVAQSERLRQTLLDLESIQNAYTNDLPVRLGELQSAQSILKLSVDEVNLKREIIESEQQRIRLGSGSISSLIQKQIDWIEARQRWIENLIRHEMAFAAWQYTRGTLLSDNGIQITNLSSTVE